MMDRQVRTVNGPKKEAFFFGKWRRNQIMQPTLSLSLSLPLPPMALQPGVGLGLLQMQPTVYTNLWITPTFIVQLLLHTSGFLAVIRLTA
jgi:hypothetical protein